ncbi:MBL fold metallo-hydrolase [Puia sp.]|jgi:glyoxylase-like metal-dependent hydrolase (beta-lactamase superfamily II)|uniref:MBL fold metallo-hydrolase n=1 Tax=Puia sp. TaxID=2045100 RepID=UPI002F4063A6
MRRRNFLAQSSLALGALSLPGQQLLASMAGRRQDPWKIRPLRNDVGIFYERGGTIAWLLSPEGIVVVDAEFPDQAGHLIGQLKKQSAKPFEMLINTHHHGDHTAGNIAFKGIVGHVAAHANSLANQQRVAVTRKNEDKQLYPDITYADSWDYKIGKERIRTAWFGPAHTNGDSIVHFEHANIAHMGDLMFNRNYAFIDNSAGASVGNWVVVLDKALSKYDNDTLFVFGHAFDPDKVTGNKDDLRAMKDYLSRMLDFVNGWIRAGKSKDDLVKEKAIPGVTEWQGDGLANGLGATYDEITAGK